MYIQPNMPHVIFVYRWFAVYIKVYKYYKWAKWYSQRPQGSSQLEKFKLFMSNPSQQVIGPLRSADQLRKEEKVETFGAPQMMPLGHFLRNRFQSREIHEKNHFSFSQEQLKKLVLSFQMYLQVIILFFLLYRIQDANQLTAFAKCLQALGAQKVSTNRLNGSHWFI